MIHPIFGEQIVPHIKSLTKKKPVHHLKRRLRPDTSVDLRFKPGADKINFHVNRSLATPSTSIEQRSGSALQQGQALPTQSRLLGERITHIGRGAVAQTRSMEHLRNQATQQTPLFNPEIRASRARQKGRTLGHGVFARI